MKVRELVRPSDFDKKAVELTLQDMFKNINYSKQKSTRPETVTVKNSKTKKVYGRRTIHQKVV